MVELCVKIGREGFWGKSGENSFVFNDSGDTDANRQTFLAKLESGGGNKGGLFGGGFVWSGCVMAITGNNLGN